MDEKTKIPPLNAHDTQLSQISQIKSLPSCPFLSSAARPWRLACLLCFSEQGDFVFRIMLKETKNERTTMSSGRGIRREI